MIKITVDKKSGHMQITADGHANSAPYGSDIICAAVSVIMQTAALGLQAIAEQYPDHVVVRYDSDLSDSADVAG